MTSFVAYICSNLPWIWTAKLFVIVVAFVPVVVVAVITVKVVWISMGLYLQPADACAGYPVTYYNLSIGSSGMNWTAVMLGPYVPESASRVEITLNSSDGIHQNVRYHFQISAVNIFGSGISSGMEFCKGWIVPTCMHLLLGACHNSIWTPMWAFFLHKFCFQIEKDHDNKSNI